MRALKINKWSRHWHRKISLLSSVPVLIIVCTGILLMLRGQFSAIQPKSVMGSAPFATPVVSQSELLTTLQALPEAETQSWKNIGSLSYRPKNGTYHARLKNNYLVQIDAATGSVLDVSYRRTSFIIALHQGSYFHKYVMLWLFLPAGISLLFLWLSGIYLIIHPKFRRKKKHV